MILSARFPNAGKRHQLFSASRIQIHQFGFWGGLLGSELQSNGPVFPSPCPHYTH